MMSEDSVTTSMSNKTLETARRIAALAQRGEDGERVNAERLLGEFLAKHGLRMEDLDALSTSDCRFEVGPDHLEFLLVAQCINSTADVKVYTVTRRADNVVVAVGAELTPAQHAEVSMKVAVLLPLFRAEQKTFLSAFIMANQLWSKGTRDKPLTEDEKKELARAERMGVFVKRGAIHKGLGSGPFDGLKD